MRETLNLSADADSITITMKRRKKTVLGDLTFLSSFFVVQQFLFKGVHYFCLWKVSFLFLFLFCWSNFLGMEGGGGTNERPGIDHVSSGPMRGLEKTAPNGAHRQITDKQKW